MQWNLIWWLNNHTNEYINNSLIVVGLTEESRVSWYNPNHKRGRDDPPWNNYLHAQWLDSAGPNVDRGWFDLHKHYLNMTASDELYRLNYETTVRLFDGVSSRYKIPVFQFNLLSKTRIDGIPSVYDINTRSILDNNYKRGGHPNEDGHEIIAKSLIKTIDNQSQ